MNQPAAPALTTTDRRRPLALRRPSGRLPAWLKLLALAYALVLVVVYARYYGPANFLWFSNVALMLTVAGILLESPLLVSTAAVGVFMPEVGWSIDLLARLITGRRAFGLTDYLWDATYPPPVRALTLYHLALSPGLWWLTGRLGYDRRAFAAWCALAGAVALLVLAAADPAVNINRLWGPGREPQQLLPRALYLLVWAIVLPLCLWWPTHRLFLWARPRAGGANDQSPSAPMTKE